MGKIILTIFLLLTLGALLVLGFTLDGAQAVSAITENVNYPVYYPYPKYYQVTVEKPIYLERIVEVEKPIEVIREKLIENIIYTVRDVRDWQSPAELMSWLEKNLAYLFPVNGITPDCDDYAERLQRKAAEDGYLLSQQLIDAGGRLYGKHVTDKPEGHVGLVALVQDKYYYIEPQPNSFRMVYITERD